MLKVRRKSWKPFRIYQLTSTANSAIFCGIFSLIFDGLGGVGGMFMFFIQPGLFTVTGGATRVISCDSCDIAWLYKDARKFNLNSYISLVGESNVMCPNGPYGYGPVLESNNPEFIALMNSCPGNDIPSKN